MEDNSNAAGPKQKKHSVVDVSGGESKIWCYKQNELRTTSTWELPLETSTCFIDNTKVFDNVDHAKLWKTLKETGIPAILSISWEIRMQVKRQQLEPELEQQAGFKLGRQ